MGGHSFLDEISQRSKALGMKKKRKIFRQIIEVPYTMLSFYYTGVAKIQKELEMTQKSRQTVKLRTFHRNRPVDKETVSGVRKFDCNGEAG